jgi:hypothetical protein
MRIAIAGAVLAGALLLDFGAIAQTGNAMSPQPGAPTPPSPVQRPIPHQQPKQQVPPDVADKPVAMTPKQAELLRKAEQIDRKVMRSICTGC